MNDRAQATHGPRPGAGDVVTGPVGSARLVIPSDDHDPAADSAPLPGAVMPSPRPDADHDQPAARRDPRTTEPDDRAKG